MVTSLYCPLNISLVTGHVSGMKTDMTQIASNTLIHFDLKLKNCHPGVIKWFQGDWFFFSGFFLVLVWFLGFFFKVETYIRAIFWSHIYGVSSVSSRQRGSWQRGFLNFTFKLSHWSLCCFWQVTFCVRLDLSIIYCEWCRCAEVYLISVNHIAGFKQSRDANIPVVGGI